MGEFFKSVRFKILSALFAVLFGFMVHSARDGTTATILAKMSALITEPISKITTLVTGETKDFFGSFLQSRALYKENIALKDEISRLTTSLVDHEKYKSENQQLKEFLDIKERNQDFDFEPAMVIGRDAGERFYSFTIDKGSMDDVSVGDPIICSWGLVGVVSEVGLTHSKVVTILDATIDIGVLDTSTREIGITSGTIALAAEGKCKLSYLPRDSAASVGDVIVTSGVGGIFPKDIVVGKISAISPESHGLSIYAEITPLQDVRIVSDVLVIKHFAGQISTKKAN